MSLWGNCSAENHEPTAIMPAGLKLDSCSLCPLCSRAWTFHGSVCSDLHTYQKKLQKGRNLEYIQRMCMVERSLMNPVKILAYDYFKTLFPVDWQI